MYSYDGEKCSSFRARKLFSRSFVKLLLVQLRMKEVVTNHRDTQVHTQTLSTQLSSKAYRSHEATMCRNVAQRQ